MELMLNITTGNDNPYEKKPKQNKPKTHYSGSGSGFAFEFTENDTVKAQVIARKRVVKPASTETSTEKPVEKPEFKLVQPDPVAPVTPKKKTSIKKKPESTFNVEELLKKDDVPNYEIPTPLPTVDFPEDKKSSKKNKNKQNKPLNNFPKDLPTVDFAEPVKVFVNPMERKKQKVKFSKVTNPFPNDPRKNPINAKSVKEEKAPLKEATAANVRTEKDSNKSVFSVDSVDSLKIHAHSIKNMKEVLNFNKLTHVQQKSVPAALEGRDLLIRSPTGSGKTLSYALPIVEKLHNIRPQLQRSDGIHALVIVPTRELAVQTYELFVKLTKPFQWIVPGYLSGGEKRKAEKSRLRNGITILISTPGRICDHLLHTESMKFDKIQVFALDEADRLLELGYENDVKKVVDTIAEQNKDNKPIQKILLSATLTSSVKKLAGLTLTDPVYVDNDSTETMTNSMMDMESDDNLVIPVGIEQKYFMIPPKLRFVVLCSLVTQQMAQGARKILIFFPTQHVVDFNYDVMVEFLTQRFTKKERTAKSYLENEDDDMGDEEDDDEDDSDIWLPNVTFFKLFGSMTQVERISVFKEFKKVKSGILLCTDVAARGLDVPELDLVIQYSAPQELNNYVHRIGRTARAGNTGSAILFITQNEDKFIDLLRQKNIEIAEDDYHKCLKDIRLPHSKIRFFEEKIVALQRKLEDLLAEDDEIRHKASKAFTSWICYYKTFSKELRHIFNLREIHMGHLANNLGLRDAPTSIVKQYANATEGRREKNKNFDFQHRVHVPRGDQNSINKLKRKYGDFTKTNFGKTSNISEFDSGLPELKKKRK